MSVHYATTAGTATAGADFQSVSGTLNWTAGDGTSKSFSVPVLTDGATESTETVDLHLSTTTGGATLGRSSAVLNIQDGAPGGAPAAPLKLAAAAASTSEILLTWLNNVTNETSYHLEMQPPGGSFTEIESLPANSTSSPSAGLAQGTMYNYRVRAENAGVFALLECGECHTDTTPRTVRRNATTLCVDDQTGDKRFKVQVSFHTTQGAGAAGRTALPLSTLGESRRPLLVLQRRQPGDADQDPQQLRRGRQVLGVLRRGHQRRPDHHRHRHRDRAYGDIRHPDVTPAPPVQDTVGLPATEFWCDPALASAGSLDHRLR